MSVGWNEISTLTLGIRYLHELDRIGRKMNNAKTNTQASQAVFSATFGLLTLRKTKIIPKLSLLKWWRMKYLEIRESIQAKNDSI